MTFMEWLDWQIQSTQDELDKWKAHFERTPEDALHWVNATVGRASLNVLCKRVKQVLSKPKNKDSATPESLQKWLEQEIEHLSTGGAIVSTGFLDQALGAERLKAFKTIHHMMKELGE